MKRTSIIPFLLALLALPATVFSRPASGDYTVFPAKRMNIVDICFRGADIWYSLDSCVLRENSADGSQTYYRTKNELPDGPIRAIFTDSKGAVWVATGEGVSRYDGSVWTHYLSDSPFNASATYDIAEDEKGVLWFATWNGVRAFDGTKWSAWRDEIPGVVAYHIATGKNGAKWFGTDKGLVRYDGAKWKTIGPQECVRTIFVDSKDRVWVLYADDKPTVHLDVITGETATATPVKITFPQNLTGAIGEAPDGSIWCGAGREFHVFDGVSWKTIPLTGDLPHTLSCVAKAPDGRLWFGGDNNEIFRIENGNVICAPLETGPAWFTVYSAAVDPRGVKWFGTERGLSRYDGTRWKTYYDRDGLAGNRVFSLAASDRFLWCGTDRGLSRFDGSAWTTFSVADGLPDSVIACLAAFDDGSGVWAGTSKGVSRFDGMSWRTYTVSEGLPAGNVTALHIDDDSGTVFAGSDAGAASFDGKTWTTLPACPDSVTAILSDSSHRLWIGTKHGLFRRGGTSWTRFHADDGVSNLPDNGIKALAEDSVGGIWAGTAWGSVRFDGTSWTPFLKFDWVYSIATGADGIVWFVRSDYVSGPVIGYSVTGPPTPGLLKGTWTLWTNRYGAGSFAFTENAVWTSPSGWTGVVRIDLATRAVRVFKTTDGLAYEGITGVAAADGKTVWATAYSGSDNMSWLMRYDGAAWSTLLTWAGKLDRVAADSKGGVWAVANRPGVHGRVYRWDTETGDMTFMFDGRSCQTIRFTPKNVALLSGNPLYTAPDSLWNSPSGYEHCNLVETPYGGGYNAIVEGQDGALWCGRTISPFGVARYDGVSWKTYTIADGLPSNEVSMLAVDTTGAVWAATKGGVARFDGEKWLVFTSQNSPIKHDDVSSVAVAPDGKVWFGSWNWIASFTYDNGTSVAESPARPALLSIAGVFPNPFNASAIIRFSLPSAGRTHLSVFDITGRKVRDLVSDFLPAGGHTVLWNGLDRSGRRAASGVYFVRLSSGGGAITRKMLLVK